MKHADSSAYNSVIVKAVTSLAEPVAAEFGLELVDVQFRREASGWMLRLVVDSESGVNIDDCAKVSREVGRILEVEDPIEQPYTLEVSSPGLDRPLRTEKDYIRCKGKKVRISTKEPVAEKREFVGIIEGFENGALILSAPQGKFKVPFEQIAKAKLVIEF